MPIYRVMHRIDGETYQVEAPFATDACNRLGWMIGDCYVQLIEETPFSDLTKPPFHLGWYPESANDDDWDRKPV